MNPSLLSEKTDIKDYLHLYLGCEVYVQKKLGNDNLVKGRITEVTRGSNHSDWIEVQFDNVVDFMYQNFNERKSNFHTFFLEEDFIKPILRPLTSMTEEEATMCDELSGGIITTYSGRAEEIRYLLSKGFDLFGLIEKGLAISSSNEKSELKEGTGV